MRCGTAIIAEFLNALLAVTTKFSPRVYSELLLNARLEYSNHRIQVPMRMRYRGLNLDVATANVLSRQLKMRRSITC